MPTHTVRLRSASHQTLRALQAALLALSALSLSPKNTAAAENTATSSSGVISGLVTNKTTGNGLIGAKVEIPALNLGTLVDNTGRYVLNVPPGTHELLVTYTGLDAQNSTVMVTAGQP